MRFVHFLGEVTAQQLLSWVRFVHFLGEVTARQFCFEIYWPLSYALYYCHQNSHWPDQIYYNSNLIHLTALKSTTNVLLLSNHQQIMMIVGTGLVCGALPFQILDLRNAASKCVEIFSEWTFLISHSFSFKNISMKLWSGCPKEQKCWQIISLLCEEFPLVFWSSDLFFWIVEVNF